MTRYIRFGYLAPRVAALVVIVCLLEVGASWGLHSAATGGGSRLVGAAVEVDSTRVALFDTRATLRGLRAADPNRPMRNLFEADLIEIDFDADALLRRSAVAERGVVRGLRFGGDRETSGALIETGDGESPLGPKIATNGAATAAAQAWIEDLSAKLSSDLADDLESTRLVEAMAQRWPERYASLVDAANALRADAEILRDEANEARRNPLRHANFFTTLPARTSGLQQRLAALHADASTLPQEFAADRAALDAARRHDEQMLRERLRIGSLDPESIAAALVDERVASAIGEVIGWLRWARSAMPAEDDARATPARRGEDIRFAGVRPRPDLLVRELALQGTVNLAGRPVELNGLVTDFTTQPARHDAPTRMIFQTGGPAPLAIRATLDRASTPIDELEITCPALDLPKTRIGAGESLAIEIAPSTARLEALVRVTGDALTGDIRLMQDDVRLDAHAGQGAPDLAKRLSVSLDQGLRGRTQAETVLTLSGTLDRPRLRLQSTLAPAIVRAVEDSFRGVAEQEANRALAKARGAVDSRLAGLESRLAESGHALTAALDGPLDALRTTAGAELASPLGRGVLPLGKLGELPSKRDSLLR